MKADVFVSWLDAGQVHHAFLQSMLQTVTDERVAGWNGILSGPLLDFARNRMVQRFLPTDIEWLLMVDSDMAWTPDDLHSILADGYYDRTIVSGWYKRLVGDLIVPIPMKDGQPVEANRGLVDVDSTGCGFLLTHRSVYEKVRFPWFKTDWRGESCIGEDVWFCERAREAGLSVWCDTDVVLSHYKSRPL